MVGRLEERPRPTRRSNGGEGRATAAAGSGASLLPDGEVSPASSISGGDSGGVDADRAVGRAGSSNKLDGALAESSALCKFYIVN